MDYLEIFNAKYRKKKITNIIISSITMLMGFYSLAYVFTHWRGGGLQFRYLTVDGTIFTTVLTTIAVVVNIVEFEKYTELTKKFIYLIRLSSAVTEGIIFIVVMISQLPFFKDHMTIFTPENMLMHVLIPILTIASFIYNDSPIGKFRFRWIFAANAYAFLYAIVVVILIAKGHISRDLVPYFFLDIRSTGVAFVLGIAAIIFCIGMGLSYVFVELNRKVYWRTLSIKEPTHKAK